MQSPAGAFLMRSHFSRAPPTYWIPQKSPSAVYFGCLQLVSTSPNILMRCEQRYTQWKKVTGHFVYLNINAKCEYFLIACWTPTPLNTLMNTSRHTIDQLLIGFPGNSFPLFF